MQDMNIDIRGRVDNIDLRLGECLLPLFETIINSIHAIEDRSISDGFIHVIVKRDSTPGLFEEDNARELKPISGFEVADNGVGFTDENFKSFGTSDSRYKMRRGGKGIGRFLWLKTFERVKIDSTYEKGDSKKRRSFVFSLQTGVPITDLIDEEVEEQERRTTIRLIGFKEKYEEKAPHKLEKIAQKIIEHCLRYFVLDEMPAITLEDELSGERLNLNREYDSWVKQSKVDDFEIREHKFTLNHFLLEAHSGIEHKLGYCANNRVVQEGKLGKRIPNLTSNIETLNAQEKFIYAGYVSGNYLDEHVNQQRTGFSGILEEGSIRYEGELGWHEIESASVAASQDFLKGFTEPVKEKKNERIREYVQNEAPEYRNLLKHYEEKLDGIQPGLSDEKLSLELYKLQNEVGVGLKETARKILEIEDFSKLEIHQAYEQFLDEWNDYGKADLAKYIVHRRITLRLLEEALKRGKDNKYNLEDTIHEMIFPMRTTSDDINFEDHNLWIVDEKLAYHHYLASDLQLKKVKPIDSEDRDRPDIIVFDRPIAVVSDEQPYSSVVILEFKRPVRNDYKANENPIDQVNNYIRKIRDTLAVTKEGRPLRVGETTPFYCYIICDLTKTLEDQAANYGFQRTPDQLGYYSYNPNHHAYIEIISFDKLIKDAYHRNKILFDKLNVSDGQTKTVRRSNESRPLN